MNLLNTLDGDSYEKTPENEELKQQIASDIVHNKRKVYKMYFTD